MNENQRHWPPGSLLGGVQGASKKLLLSLGTQKHAEPGEVIIREGASGTLVYLLLAGSVKVTGATEPGVDALLAIRVGGDAVGELAALDEQPRLATVTTAGPVHLLIIKQADFLNALQRDPKLALAVARGVSDKLRTATSRRIDFTGCDVITRLARVLLELANRYGEESDAGRTLGCPLTQGELATLASAGEVTVQRALRQLRAEGIVATGYRETTVLDMAALKDRAYPG